MSEQLFVVLRSGRYCAPGEDESKAAEMCVIVGIYSARERADVIASSDAPGVGWGTCVTWVDVGIIDAPPIGF